MKFGAYKALTFDVYGTLIDWEPHIVQRLRKWAALNDVSASDAELLSAFDDARAHYQKRRPAMPYPEVLCSSYAYVCDRWRKPVDRGEQNEFSSSVKEWDPFPDTVDALIYLKQHFLLGALSNIDEVSLGHSLKKMGVEFDLVVTAERAEAYKPDMPHFIIAANDLGQAGVAVHEQLHVAQSLRADIRPANDLRLANVWINRGARQLGQSGHGAELAVPDMEYASLAEFVDAHRQDIASRDTMA
jgi:putative hydrolase of the HAD superfamily